MFAKASVNKSALRMIIGLERKRKFDMIVSDGKKEDKRKDGL